jgi:hypothetical protein
MATPPPNIEYPKPISTLPYMGNYAFYVNSRYGTTRTVRLLDPEAGVFLVHGESAFSRMGASENDSTHIELYDFEGGPFLMLGENFYDFGTIAALLPTETQDMPSHGIKSEPAVLVSVNYSPKGYKEIRKWQKQSIGR